MPVIGRRRFSLIIVCASALAAVAAGVGAKAASPETDVTLYAVTVRAQFVNEADDIARGGGTNPFNVDVKTVPPRPNGKAPLPGDDALFEFKLYSDTALKHAVGFGSYTCKYGFGNVGICEAYFSLGRSTLFGSGPVDFDKTAFTVALSGGTGAYFNDNGEVLASRAGSASAKNETVLRFVLLH